MNNHEIPIGTTVHIDPKDIAWRDSGDLISREAFKKALEVTQYNDFDDLIRTERLIDNAPPVEVPENTVNCVLTMFGKCSYNETGCSDCEIKNKIRKALNARSKGEWIEGEEETGALGIVYKNKKCSQCGWESSLLIPHNFCPNCGADMKGGEE